LNQGWKVTALVRKPQALAALGLEGVTPLRGDLAQPESLRGLFPESMDALFHVAALYRQEGVDKRLFETVNATATGVLMEEAARVGIPRIVHSSTVGVQGEIRNPPATEDAPFAPGDHYQLSKLEGERMALKAFETLGLHGVVVRPVGIYGPGDTRFLKLFRQIARRRFRMIGTGKVLYHLTFVEDLVEGMLLAATADVPSGRVYTLGGPEYLPLSELVQRLARILEVPPPPSYSIPLWPVWLAAAGCEALCRPLRLEPPLYRRRLDFFTKDRAFDISRARKELGFAPRVGLEEGLRRTAVWYREKGLI